MDQQLEQLIEDAEISMRENNFEEALNRWEVVRKKFPHHESGYARAALACMELRDFTQAELFCKLGMEKVPCSADPFRYYAEVSMRQRNFKEALDRYAVVREKFPRAGSGYVRSAVACMALKDFIQAENFCKQAIEKSLDSEPLFRTYAEISMKQRHFKEALNRYSLVREKFPECASGYEGSVFACMELHDFAQAEIFCEQGIEKISHSLQLLIARAENFMRQRSFKTALEHWAIVREKFPEQESGYIRAIHAYMELNDFISADMLIQQAIQKFSSNFILFKQYFYISLYRTDISEKNALQQALQRSLIMAAMFPNEFVSYRITLNVLYGLLDSLEDYTNIYNLFFERTLKKFTNQHNKISYDISKSKKICFCTLTVSTLSYYASIVGLFSPSEIDIIVFNRSAGDIDYINRMQLSSYNFLYGDHEINSYVNIVMDVRLFKFLSVKLHDGINIISLINAVDSTIGDLTVLNKSSLIIFASKNQNDLSNYILTKNLSLKNIELLKDIKPKCEFAYTGPYHIGEYFKKRYLPKQILRSELSDYIKAKIPNDKPLIVVFEDEISNPGQIVIGLNKISKFATIIYKPLYSIDSKILNRLSKDIIIFSRYEHASNPLRFAADFIMAGYNSGTFLSSIMLGLNILPYFSRIVKIKDSKNPHHQPYKYTENIPTTIKFNHYTAKSVMLYKFKRFFDILDTASIKDAILGTEYLDWYHKNLPELQREAFGDYMLEESPQKTVEYIKCFFRDGTLGRDCSAIYLNEQYFNKK